MVAKKACKDIELQCKKKNSTKKPADQVVLESLLELQNKHTGLLVSKRLLVAHINAKDEFLNKVS